MSRPFEPDDPEQRSAFRAFVRDHHPDRGGDPEAFAAGLERIRSAGAAEPTRTDGPMPFPVRVGVALIRTWRRRHARPDAP